MIFLIKIYYLDQLYLKLCLKFCYIDSKSHKRQIIYNKEQIKLSKSKLNRQKMILNLGRPSNSTKTMSNSLMSNDNFLKQNKITVNQVASSHFTVQGVQSYTPQQMKALKLKQQKLIANKQGIFVQTKVYHVSDDFQQISENNQDEQSKGKIIIRGKKNPTFKKLTQKIYQHHKQPAKAAMPLKVKDKSAKKKLEGNNSAISKLQKQRDKKSVLQKKLQKLSKQYKQYFKSNQQVIQGQNNDNQQQNNNNQQQNQQVHQNDQQIHQNDQQIHQNDQQINSNDQQIHQNDNDQNGSLCDSIMSLTKGKHKKLYQQQNQLPRKPNKRNKPSTSASSMGGYEYPKQALKHQKTKAVPIKHSSSRISNHSISVQDETEFEEVDFQEVGIDLIGQIMKKNKSGFSQRLGSAVHLLFK